MSRNAPTHSSTASFSKKGTCIFFAKKMHVPFFRASRSMCLLVVRMGQVARGAQDKASAPDGSPEGGMTQQLEFANATLQQAVDWSGVTAEQRGIVVARM